MKPIESALTAKPGSPQSDSARIDATVMNRAGALEHNAVDDGELARRLADGDSNALAQVYDRYAASLYRMLQATLSSSVDAEDALQEVFVKLAMGRLSRIRDLKSYLFVAARHEAFNILRRRKRESTLDEGGVAFESVNVTASDEGIEAPGYDWAALLARLPLEQREVIALKVWEQMTFIEIARIVRVSPNTVMSRYRYGIERLRSWCREEDEHEL